MLNPIDDMKRLVGVLPEDTGIDDRSPLSSGETPWESYLTDCALISEELLREWGADVDGFSGLDTGTQRKLRRAEVLLVQARIVIDHGMQETIAPDEVQSGGSEGTKVRNRRISAADREDRAQRIIGQAWRLVTGQEPEQFAGVV